MFMCKHCLEQYDDNRLAYTLVPEVRSTHPAADAFVLKFCSKDHLQQFLQRMTHQHQPFLLVKKGAGGDKPFEPATALDLLALTGHTRAS